MAGLALVVAGGTGCAARPRTLASRFVTPGTPLIDVGGVAAATLATTARPGSAPPPAVGAPRAVAGRVAGGITLEAGAPGLQRALLTLALAPSAAAHVEVAAAYRRLGVIDTAVDYLLVGLERHPSDVALHDALARAWRDWGLPDRGLTAAHRAVYHAPASAEARNTLGTVLWALGDRGAARQAFADAAALEPRASYAWRNLCTAQLAAGDTRAAVASCRRAVEAARP